VTEIQQNRYDQLVRRVGGLIGPGSKVSEVISELFPMIDVENLPGELYVLAGTRLGFGSAVQISPVAEFPRVQLFNPVGSGTIVTVTTIWVSATAAGQVRLVSTINPESTDVLAIVRDTRLGVLQATTAEVRAASEAASLAANGAEFRTGGTLLNTLTDPNGIIVLAPGTGLTVTLINDNETLTVSFFWRERVAEASELNF